MSLGFQKYNVIQYIKLNLGFNVLNLPLVNIDNYKTIDRKHAMEIRYKLQNAWLKEKEKPSIENYIYGIVLNAKPSQKFILQDKVPQNFNLFYIRKEKIESNEKLFDFLKLNINIQKLKSIEEIFDNLEENKDQIIKFNDFDIWQRISNITDCIILCVDGKKIKGAEDQEKDIFKLLKCYAPSNGQVQGLIGFYFIDNNLVPINFVLNSRSKYAKVFKRIQLDDTIFDWLFSLNNGYPWYELQKEGTIVKSYKGDISNDLPLIVKDEKQMLIGKLGDIYEISEINAIDKFKYVGRGQVMNNKCIIREVE